MDEVGDAKAEAMWSGFFEMAMNTSAGQSDDLERERTRRKKGCELRERMVSR